MENAMNEMLQLIENQSDDEDKIGILNLIYSCGFEHGQCKIDEEFGEAVEEILKLTGELDK